MKLERNFKPLLEDTAVTKVEILHVYNTNVIYVSFYLGLHVIQYFIIITSDDVSNSRA